jgi:hypothetical protein
VSKGYTEHDKERIVAIATALLGGMVKAKEVDPCDDEAMTKAMHRCVREAASVYAAALEFVCG